MPRYVSSRVDGDRVAARLVSLARTATTTPSCRTGITSRRRGAAPDQSGSPSVIGRPDSCAATSGSAAAPVASVPTKSSGWLVGAVSGRTCATHHQAPLCNGTHSVRSAKARSASSCQSATSRRAWSTWEGLAEPRVRRSDRLLIGREPSRAAALPLVSSRSGPAARPSGHDGGDEVALLEDLALHHVQLADGAGALGEHRDL